MRKRNWPLVWAVVGAPAVVLLMGAANGAWLARVPAVDHTTVNPMAGHADAIAAGSALYQENCAKCHGTDGNGRGSRPPVRSARVAGGTDGDLYWLLSHGQPFRGMPSWARLPEEQRWEMVAYLRSLQGAPATK